MRGFPEDKFLRVFLVGASLLVTGSVWLLFNAKHDWNKAVDRFSEVAAELDRLEGIAPYPNRENLEGMRILTSDYENALAGIKEELTVGHLPIQPLAPTEFQSHLRKAISAFVDKARANKVKLPEKFCLGFDEYAAALPNSTAAPLLGQELTQIELLLESLVEAHIDALSTFHRIPLREEQEVRSPMATAAPASKGPMTNSGRQGLIERSVVEATFLSTPAAARQLINQIASISQQFFIIRLLRIRNENDRGPIRELSVEATNNVAPASEVIAAREHNINGRNALNFIVGNEHIEVSARIEIVRFTF